MSELLQETKESYYTYIANISEGSKAIANELRINNFETAFHKIANFAEGLEWLVKVEEIMVANGYSITSRITKANEFLNEINNALSESDFVTVADIFEYEIAPLFSSASEWIFEKVEGQ